MSSNRISNGNIDRVSTFLSRQTFDESIQKQLSKIGEKVSEFIATNYIDSSMLNLYRSRSYYMRKIPNFSLFSSKSGKYITSIPLDLPLVTPHFEKTDLTEDKELKALISEDVEELEVLGKNKDILYNKIRCALADLKYYTKIKNEFPEAYNILMKYDSNQKKTEVKDPCTKIEELRAEITSKNK